MNDRVYPLKAEVKICGLTNRADALHALSAGADYLGFVMYSGSSRGIGREKLAGIVAALPEDARVVGVFVNEDRSVVCDIVNELGLYAVQLHGDEDVEEFSDMPCRLWRAVKLKRGRFRPDPGHWNAERYVVDSTVPGEYGGTGVTADWHKSAEFARVNKMMLAGGLTAENVRSAVETVRPSGVDVASGVEKSPGIKDREAVELFIEEAKSVDY
jgi:phosphoribosylanthranilate isomerase